MKNKILQLAISLVFLVFAFQACAPGEPEQTEITPMEQLVSKYVQVPLTADISHLSANEKEMLKLLFQAADIMDNIFWTQNIAEKEAFLADIEDPAARQFAKINYGPWDQLDNQKPFLDGYGPKTPGAQFYPADMTAEEFEAFDNPDKKSQYTLIQRDETGALKTVWYHDAYADQIEEAASLLRQAAELAGDAEFAEYLRLRAKALLTDDYLESDMAWMDIRNNHVDFVVGPIENYLDSRYGYKAAHEAFILIKDIAWSDRLSRYAEFLPELQTKLPVAEKYKKVRCHLLCRRLQYGQQNHCHQPAQR